MHKFPEKFNLPILNEAESLNRPVTPDEIETVIKKLLTDKSPGPHGFTREFYRVFKGELTPILQRLFQKIRGNQDGGVGRHTAPPRTTRTDRESNSKGDRHQGNRK